MGLLDSILGMNSADATQAAVGNGTSTLYDSATAANRALNQGAQAARGDLTQAAGAATGAINQNYGGARTDLTNYGGQAQGLLSKGIGDAVGTVQGSNANYSPYLAGGGSASGMLSNALGLNGPQGNATATAAFQADPGYQYQVDQATDAAARKAASLGMSASGNTLDAITRLGSNLANQGYQSWLSNLQGLSGQGLTAAAGVSGNNQAAAGYQYGGGTTGAQLAQSLGTNLGNLGVQQGNQLAGIQTGLGSSLAGVDQSRAQGISGNLMNTGSQVAGLDLTGGLAQDAVDNANSGILSKALGGFLAPEVSAASKSLGGLIGKATGGYL